MSLVIFFRILVQQTDHTLLNTFTVATLNGLNNAYDTHSQNTQEMNELS